MDSRKKNRKPILCIDGEDAVIDPTDDSPGKRPNGMLRRGRLPKSWNDVAACDLFVERFGGYRRKQERRPRIHFDNVTSADEFAAAARLRTQG